MKQNNCIAAVLVGVLILAGAMRLWHPGADAPYDLSFCEAEDTDWAWYLNRAFAASGCATVDPYLNASYNPPIFTGYARAYLKIFAPSEATLTGLNLLPGLLVVGLLATVLWQVSGAWAGIAGAALAAANYLLVMYSRVPLVYMWVLVFELLPVIFWRKRWGKVFAVAILLVGALALKGFCLLFLVCVLLAGLPELKAAWKKDQRRALMVTFGGVGCGLMALVAFRAQVFSDYVKIVAYLWRSQLLRAPRAEWLRFWRNTGGFLYARLLGEMLLAYASILLLALQFRAKKRLAFADLYFAAIFLLGHLAILPFSYRPMRYLLFLLPAILYLAVRALPLLRDLDLGKGRRFSWRLAMVAAIWSLPLSNGAAYLLRAHFDADLKSALLLTLVGGAIVGVAVPGILRFLSNLARRETFVWMMVPALLVVLLATQGVFYAIWARQPTYSLKESREEIAEILPAGAGLAGPYAQMLCWGEPCRGVTIAFGEGNFASFGPQAQVASAAYAVFDDMNLDFFQTSEAGRQAMQDWRYLDSLFVRGSELKIFRLPGPTDVQSLFEQALMTAGGDEDKAKDLWLRSAEKFPASSASMRALVAQAQRRGTDPQPYLDEAARRNPEHTLIFVAALAQARRENQPERSRELTLKILHSTSNTEFVRKHIVELRGH